MIGIVMILGVAALVGAILSASTNKVPLWVPVVFLSIAFLLEKGWPK